MKKHEIAVGQPMYYFLRGDNSAPTETEVISVGRKYFEVNHFPRDKFFIDSLRSNNEVGCPIQLYPSIQAIEDKREHNALSRELRQLFGQYGSIPYSLDTLRKVKEIIGTNTEK